MRFLINDIIDNYSIKVNDQNDSYQTILIALILYKKYNIIDTQFRHINSIFLVSGFRYEGIFILNVNEDKEKTFPLQIYNRYDYFVVFYKRQIHKMMIRKWKCAMYKPNSKYVLKLKDNFEKIEKMGVFGR